MGVFGFLGADELRTRDTSIGNSTGVYGLQDQREAMRWTQRNIRALGGDPSRVFIFGESAGAGSVTNHLVMSESWGLFARAGMESGAFSQFDSAVTFDNAQQTYECLVAETGCDSNGQAVECLQALSAEKLLAAQVAIGNTVGNSTCLVEQPAYMFYPPIDGVEITDAPWALLRDGGASACRSCRQLPPLLAPGVDILLGSNADDVVTSHEHQPSCAEPANCTQQEFEDWVSGLFSASAPKNRFGLGNPPSEMVKNLTSLVKK